MESTPRPTLDRMSLTVPFNVKALLNVRGLDVYDVLQALAKAINKVIITNDSNIDKEEEFLTKLSEQIDAWTTEQEGDIARFKNEIINYISTGQLDLNGFITSPEAFGQEFWGNIAASLLDKGDILPPGADGNEYSKGGEIEPGSHWVLRLKMWGGGSNFVDIQPLYNAIYNASTVFLDVDEEEGAELHDDDDNSRGVIPFASAIGGGLMHKDDKAKLDDIRWDAEHLLLHVDGQAFRLTPYEEEEEDNIQYYTPRVDIEYADVPESGGKVYPSVTVTQQIRILPRNGGISQMKFIIAHYDYDPVSGQMVTTYTNGEYIKDGGQLALTFTFENVASGVVTNASDGSVAIASAATSNESRKLATVNVAAIFNGFNAEEEVFADVFQEASSEVIPPSPPEITIVNGVTSLVFSTTAGTPQTREFTVKGSNLSGNITLALTGDNATKFRLSETTITKATAQSSNGKRIVVTYNPDEAGTHIASIVLTSDGADNKTISLSGSAASNVDNTTVYYGSDDAIPTELGNNSVVLNAGTNTIVINGYNHVHWVAIPNTLAAVVTGKDYLGSDVTLGTDTTSISGYVIKYRRSIGTIGVTTFTIVV